MADHDAGAVALCGRDAVADVDSRIIEPADLWTAACRPRGVTSCPRALPRAPPEDYWYVVPIGLGAAFNTAGITPAPAWA